MTLKKYHQKRDFKQTPEPKGKILKRSGKKKKFIIQKHAASHLHYDFRLELDGVLKSWAVPKGPSLDPAVKRLAMHVEDHPIEYGTFEGKIPKGQYGGGTVMLWDKGVWISEDENPTRAYHAGNMKFTLEAEKLQGRWKLIRIKQDEKSWLLIKIKDDYAKTLKSYDITVKKPNSVLTNQTMDEIAENYKHLWSDKGLQKAPSRKKKLLKSPATAKSPGLKLNLKPNLSKKNFPNRINPELATLADEPPQGDGWIHEIKLDGYRILAFKKNDKTRLISRNQNDWTPKFKTIADSVTRYFATDVVVDGEIVVLDKEARSNFQLLQNSIKDPEDSSFVYYIFDLLYYDQYNLMHLPLIERKTLLNKLLSNNNNDQLRLSDHIIGSGKKILEKACQLKLEGIISKESQSEYVQKRSRSWLKTKCTKRQEFVIGGFTKPQGKRLYFGSLLLGTYNKKKQLQYNGNVGTGFNAASLKTIHNQLQKYKTTNSSFAEKITGTSSVTWLKPKVVAEVEFSEWTQDGSIRHPSFKGLRSDKPASAIIHEQEIRTKSITHQSNSKSKPRSKLAMRKKSATPKKTVKATTKKASKSSPEKNSLKKKSRASSEINKNFRLTSPQRIVYPEDKITKLELAEYYETIQEKILPYIINRPLTLVRCPDGYKNMCFYQKHINKTTPPELHGILIKEKESKEECIYIKDFNGLMALTQISALEIHPWGSSNKDIEHPDMITFDLDPGPDLAWKKVVSAAFEIKDLLASINLRSFVKTTGGKGLHVVVPIKPKYEWEEIKNFTHTVADYLVRENPTTYIDKMTKSKRVGKVYIDYLRNQRGATAIAPYSTRARQSAPIAVPLAWEELTNNFKDIFYTLKTINKRFNSLKKDPWLDFFKIKQSIDLKKFK